MDTCIKREMMSARIIYFACVLLIPAAILAVEEVELEIGQGKLKGIKTKTHLDQKPLYMFTGIPYAKSIEGPNKFKVAEPPEPWSGVYEATHQGSGCVSYCMMRHKVVGEDDCLFLNVYTPEPNKDARKAVMVFFHGGGFNMGSAETDFYGPYYIVEEDVVLVTVNSRLGVFGFLSTEDSTAPGNLGLKDQAAALKWVQENIKYFGGCPQRVTIFGQSSGGASVQYHMMSPMSAGLFQNALSQGGSAVAPWAITHHAKDAAFKLGKALGIDTTDSAILLKELSQLPSYEIVEAAMTVDQTENGMNGHSHAFIPSVEPDVGQEVFLPADPWELIMKGKIADVPYMAGLNLNETLFLKSALIASAEMMNEHFENFIPDDLNVTDAAEQKQIADMMRKFYLDDKPLTRDLLREFGQITMDVMFTCPVQIPLTIINSLKSTPTYNYLFIHDSSLGIFKIMGFYDGTEGVIHGDEMGYILHNRFLNMHPEPGSELEGVIRLLTKLWANFAKTGNPTPALDEYITMNWEPMGKENNYAVIDQGLTMEKNMFKERIDFWIPIYKNVIGDFAKLF
ncbi:cholinesterase 1-like [Diprion similis]|uniref:cholinesterase 1-like n=1 Tax=Diprion similis TaxID=362088 RepID=UPI001EF856DC|nr:cholinesterase 1-like [Diprion similis]